MPGRPWTPEEIEAVLAAPDEPALRVVAEKIGRSFHGAKNKRRRVLNPPPRKPRAPQEPKPPRAPRPRNRLTVIHGERTAPGEVSEAGRRRGQLRRAIEDREAELHLARLLADDDW